MINKIIFGIVILLLSSCSISFHTNLSKIEKRKLEPTDFNSAFDEGFDKVLYKANIKLQNKHFSGLFFIKSIDKDTKRVVFVTEVGIKIFEFEFYKDEFRVNHCLEMFNKKIILRTLEKDLHLLLQNNLVSDYVKIFEDKKNNLRVFKLKNNRQRNYYFVNKENGNLDKIENMSCIFRKVIVEFNDYKKDFPYRIDIKHTGIRLNIQLKLIEN